MAYRGRPSGWKKPHAKPKEWVDSFNYYKRYLLMEAQSVFIWEMPDTWDYNYVLDNLYLTGFLVIGDISPYGVIPQKGTINGYNIYHRPSRALISNPYLPNTTYNIDIGENGELLYLMEDLHGINDTLTEYATMLANASAGVNSNLYNSKLSYIFYAKNTTQAESYKKMYDAIGTGEPAVFVDNKLRSVDSAGNTIEPWQPFNANLSQNYISDKILEDMRRIEHMFCQKIGIPSTNTEKKERLSVDETNKTDTESMACANLWLDTINRQIAKIKKLYPEITLSCKMRYNIDEGGEEVDTQRYNDTE